MEPGTTRDVLPAHPADCNAVAARLGWMPYYPQFRQNPLDICDNAVEEGRKNGRGNHRLRSPQPEGRQYRDGYRASGCGRNVRVMMFWRPIPSAPNVGGMNTVCSAT